MTPAAELTDRVAIVAALCTAVLRNSGVDEWPAIYGGSPSAVQRATFNVGCVPSPVVLEPSASLGTTREDEVKSGPFGDVRTGPTAGTHAYGYHLQPPPRRVVARPYTEAAPKVAAIAASGQRVVLCVLLVCTYLHAYLHAYLRHICGGRLRVTWDLNSLSAP